jgi:hypothetical protein
MKIIFDNFSKSHFFTKCLSFSFGKIKEKYLPLNQKILKINFSEFISIITNGHNSWQNCERKTKGSISGITQPESNATDNKE